MADVRRSTGILGGLYVVATVVGIALLGTLPDKDDGGSELARYYTDHRGSILAASILLALAAGVSVAFWAGVRRLLRGDESTTFALDVGLVNAVVIFAMAGVAAAAGQTAAFVAGAQGGLDPKTAETLTGFLGAITNLSAAPTLLLAAAFGIAMRRTAVFKPWIAVSLFVVGAAHILALVSVANDGAFRPGGAMTYIPPILYVLWVAATSVALLRRP